MKYVLFFLVLVVAPGCYEKKISDITKEVSDFRIKRGVNISHWLSQSRRRGEDRKNFFTREDMDFIAAQGFDHVRIPVDEEQMWDTAGNRETEAFALLKEAIQWADSNQLRVIVDLHILRSHHFNEDSKPLWTDPKAQEQFFQCWVQLSDELHTYSNNLLAYELMNEPVADDPEEWNVLVNKALKVVREKEPYRKVVIGSNQWQSVHTFKDLKVPENDTNIILSFHFYHPFVVTHYKAGWTDIKEYTGSVTYPGLTIQDEDLAGLPEDLYQRMKKEQKIYNRDSLESLMMEPVRVAEKYGLPLYCGEWGCLPSIPDSMRRLWYRDMRYCLEKNNISWANWDYKGGFGIVDPRNGDAPYPELIHMLTGTP